MTNKQKEQQEAVRILKEWGVVDGTKIYTRVVHVARSGMSRIIVLECVLDGKIVDISYWAAKALEWGYRDDFPRGVRVGGCGMDMCLHTVYSLSYAMGYGECDQRNGEQGHGLVYAR